MSIKRYDGSNYVDVENIKRFDGSNWVDTETNMRYDGSNWVEFLSRTPKFTLDAEVGIKTKEITRIADNRIRIYIVGNGTECYVRFRCFDIVIPASVTSYHNYTLNGFNSSRELMIGIQGDKVAYYSTEQAPYGSDTVVNMYINNNNDFEANPAFKFTTTSSVGRYIEVQLDSFSYSDKTFYPVFDFTGLI